MTTAAAPPKTRPTRLQRRLIRALARDLQSLIPPMERDLKRAFRDLGKRAVAAFRQSQGKSLDVGALAWAEGFLKQIDPQDAARVDAMTRSMHITDWDEKILKPGYERSYLRTMELTADTIRTTTGLAVNLPDSVGRRIVSDGGRRIGLVDIQGQSRTALFHSLAEGRALGEGPDALARRIRDRIGRGRYKSIETRAYVIARTETKYAQNLSSIELYQSMETVTGMLAFDAQVGATDAECEQRNGVVYSAADARSELGFEHPLGTLSFAPEIGRPRRPQPTTSPPESHTPLPSAPRVPEPVSAAVSRRADESVTSVLEKGFERNASNLLMDEHRFRDLAGYVDDSAPGIQEYVGPYFKQMNEKLRRGISLDPTEQRILDDLLKHAGEKSSLNNRVVTRGFGSKSDATTDFTVPRYRAGDTIDLTAPTSTSTSLDASAGYSYSREVGDRVIMEIHTTGKTRAVITNTVDKEVILAPGQRIRIVDVRHDVEIPSWMAGDAGHGANYKVGQWVVAHVEDLTDDAVRALARRADDVAGTVARAVDGTPLPAAPRVPAPVSAAGSRQADDAARAVARRADDVGSVTPTQSLDYFVPPQIDEVDFRALDGFIDEMKVPELHEWIYGRNFDINKRMLEGVALSDEQLQVMNTLHRISDRRPGLNNRVLLRGEARAADFDPQPGDLIDLAQFTSTSADRRTATKFSQLFKSEKTPTRVFYEIRGAGNTQTIITNSAETEVILGPGTRLRVLEVKKNVKVRQSADGALFEKSVDVERYVVAVVE